jgi:hypothetical protein
MAWRCHAPSHCNHPQAIARLARGLFGEPAVIHGDGFGHRIRTRSAPICQRAQVRLGDEGETRGLTDTLRELW